MNKSRSLSSCSAFFFASSSGVGTLFVDASIFLGVGLGALELEVACLVGGAFGADLEDEDTEGDAIRDPIKSSSATFFANSAMNVRA